MLMLCENGCFYISNACAFILHRVKLCYSKSEHDSPPQSMAKALF